MSPRFFIDRPIFASVLSIVIVVVGLVSMQVLPVAQYPEITPPVVQIEGDYPGASAEVVADDVSFDLSLSGGERARDGQAHPRRNGCARKELSAGR